MTDTSCPVTIVGREGEEHTVNWSASQSLMEAIRDNDLPISAECGGSASCATCHVHLDARSFAHFPPADGYEVEMLEEEENYVPGVSRLSCQIRYDPEFEGVCARIAAPPLDF